MFPIRLFVSASLFLTTIVSAHGDMPSFEKMVDGYLVDIGYTDATPAVGQEITFNADLFTGAGDAIKFAPFQTVSLVVMKDGNQLIAKTLPSVEPNIPSFKISFPETGTYSIVVAFDRGEGSVIRVDFPLQVSGSEKAEINNNAEEVENLSHYLLGTVLLIFGAVATVIMIRQRM
jgi:hypothetical protein